MDIPMNDEHQELERQENTPTPDAVVSPVRLTSFHSCLGASLAPLSGVLDRIFASLVQTEQLSARRSDDLSERIPTHASRSRMNP
jgi:hypothetical protein